MVWWQMNEEHRTIWLMNEEHMVRIKSVNIPADIFPKW
jgi:hypothetical protein